MISPDNRIHPVLIENDIRIGIPDPKTPRKDIPEGMYLGENHRISSGSTICSNVFIGKNFTCGSNVLIRGGAAIGDNVTIGNNVIVSPGVCIESGVTLDGNISVPEGTVICQGTCIGENVRFLGDLPQNECPSCAGPVRLKDNSIIGRNCILHPGVIVGEFARAAPNTRISRNIPANIFAIGDPMEFQSGVD